MVCNETQSQAGRDRDSILGHCGARQDSRNARCLSHKSPGEGREVEDVHEASLPRSSDSARRDDNNGLFPSHNTTQEVQNPDSVSEGLNSTQPKENAGTEVVHFEQNAHCTPSLSCEVGDADRHAGTQEDDFKNEQSANITVEGTTGTHDKPAYFVQTMVTLLMAWGVLAVSTPMSFPGVTLPQFTDPDTDDLHLESQSLSLLVSMVEAGTMVGSLVAGQLLAPLGARVTILIGLPLAMVSWLGLFYSSQLWILLTCRILQGCAFALVKPSTIMYLVEVAHESLRGRIVGVVGITKEVGFFSSYLLGGLMLTWRQLSFIFACILVPPAIAVFFLPNSPRWLTNHGRIPEARRSLVFFRGRHYDVEAELREVIRQANEAGSNTSTRQQLKLLLRPGTLKMFLFVLFMFIAYPLQGIAILSNYMMIILDTPGMPLDLSLSSFLCGIVKMAGGITNFIISDYIGRVSIMVVTLNFMAVSAFAYAYYIYFLDLNSPNTATWIPLASVITLQFHAGICGPILDVMQGELLPNSCRAATMPIITLLNGLCVFGTVSSFYYLLELINMAGIFGIFITVNIIMALVCMLVMPETRGMSLEAISDAVHS
ncbi:facilitated trehalose transporter Tret1-like isoform X2 [Portunus trituberculatus]|uniref:facilitated trehalose transporter Tret1-like isoform X2 n=1 Tax=Portunus trituberculatus TaxID=210409 RepID=UPI001E1CC8F0|nr:facilitated trehalose transporter Tret1-like isoform X2 [Portunus trituberculatus]